MKAVTQRGKDNHGFQMTALRNLGLLHIFSLVCYCLFVYQAPEDSQKGRCFLSVLIYGVVRVEKDCKAGIIHWVCNNTKIQEKPTSLRSYN